MGRQFCKAAARSLGIRSSAMIEGGLLIWIWGFGDLGTWGTWGLGDLGSRDVGILWDPGKLVLGNLDSGDFGFRKLKEGEVEITWGLDDCTI